MTRVGPAYTPPAPRGEPRSLEGAFEASLPALDSHELRLQQALLDDYRETNPPEPEERPYPAMPRRQYVHRDMDQTPGERVAGVVLALILGVLGAMALAHWAAS